uniref:Fe2OG dioxygenase domain-containing protein n=1 Tax=Ditylum brightwellii TaxID=49249 RepID=A0A7S2A4Z6_9STRA|mmetsp:Transcript_8596/g.12832  ORF Transcript_8596/g.12832 Transcript_8596/m.12832 type:complete len:491 (+) Transcript_8596:54-1526(+)
MAKKRKATTNNNGNSPPYPDPNAETDQPKKKKTAFSVWVVAASIPGIMVAFLVGLGFPDLDEQNYNSFPSPTSKLTTVNKAPRKMLEKGGPPGSWTYGYYADEVSSSSEDGASRAWLYPNGGDGNPKYVSFNSDDDFYSLGRVYNDHGQIVSSRHHFQDGASLYSGPTEPGQHFQWPSIKVGLKRVVPGLSGDDGKPVEIETLTDPNDDDGFSPRIFYVHNFLSTKEADELIRISMAEDNPYKMAQSTAGSHKSWDKEGGRDAVSSTRTSMNAFDISSSTALAIKKRGFRLLRLGEYQESLADGIQILRYELGQAYIAHDDFFPVRQSADHNWNPERGGSNRMATIFLYLSDVDVGGQTVFPKLKRLTNNTSADLVERLSQIDANRGDAKLQDLASKARITRGSWEDQLIRQCQTKFAVPPRKGDAILFYSQKPNGKLDHASLHGACPILSGTKWGANLWVWNACRYSLCKVDPHHPAAELPPNMKAPFH